MSRYETLDDLVRTALRSDMSPVAIEALMRAETWAREHGETELERIALFRGFAEGFIVGRRSGRLDLCDCGHLVAGHGPNSCYACPCPTLCQHCAHPMEIHSREGACGRIDCTCLDCQPQTEAS